MESRGAMTVPKLVTIILAVVVLVFLIFGASHLKPLYNRIGGIFDNVLYFFGLGEDGDGDGDCTSLRILGWNSEGKAFLDNVGVPRGEQEGAFLFSCEGICGVTFQSGENYRIRKGSFDYKLDKGEWYTRNEYLFSRNAGDTKEAWEVYHGVLDLIGEEMGPEEFGRIFEERISGSFWLYGNGEGRGDSIYYYWESGVWYAYRGEDPKRVSPTAYDLEMAVSYFYGTVGKGNDDEVYFIERDPILGGSSSVPGHYTNRDIDPSLKTPEGLFDQNKKKLDADLKSGLINQEEYNEKLSENWRPVNYLIGGMGNSGNYELDNDDEEAAFLGAVREIIERIEGERKIPGRDIEKLENALQGKQISAGGNNYALSLDVDPPGFIGRPPSGIPQIKASRSGEEYAFMFDSAVAISREGGDYGVPWGGQVPLRNYPLKLLRNGVLVAGEKDYKLPESVWDEFYKLNLIKDFIKSKCY